MWVKICGMTALDDVETVAALQPDAIGLNFYRGSRRCVDVPTARQLVARLPETIRPVGLFVNHSLEEIRHISSDCGLRWLQLHGDETPEFVAQLREYQLIRAFRVSAAGLDDVARQLAEYRRLGITLQACLIDAHVAGTYGGTGHSAPWSLLARDWDPAWPALILAGGLTPQNVAAAIETVRPWGVDVASGVESAPGRQDPDAVKEFISVARRHASSGWNSRSR